MPTNAAPAMPIAARRTGMGRPPVRAYTDGAGRTGAGGEYGPVARAPERDRHGEVEDEHVAEERQPLVARDVPVERDISVFGQQRRGDVDRRERGDRPVQPRARKDPGPEAGDEYRDACDEHDLEHPAEGGLRGLEAVEALAAEEQDEPGDLEGDERHDAESQSALAELVDDSRLRSCERAPLRSLHGNSSLGRKRGPGPLAGPRSRDRACVRLATDRWVRTCGQASP